MKLLCSESSYDLCSNIASLLEKAGIKNSIMERHPSLFDEHGNNSLPTHEVWIIDDADFEKAFSTVYREQDTDSCGEPD